jgi:maltose alpha-D-glucosyltransferase/alpha-amylase
MARNIPLWLRDAVFYEIYPQSFQDSNGDGIGDLQGIISRLDYIQDLGCTALWLNPCFLSPFDDAGYDIADYCTVAPRYGTNEDMKALFAAAHERGLHVILDLVPGHTSYQHPWFQASMEPEPNPYTDRYVWTDSVWSFPEGFQCLRGISQRNGSAIVNFFSTQPALNYGFYVPKESWQQPMDAPGPMSTRQALKDIMGFWLNMGCDGFRVDMAGSLVKNDPDQKGTIALWQDIRGFLDREFPNAVLVSEWGEPDKSLQGGFDMDFLLQFGPSHYNDLFHCKTPYFSKSGTGSAREFIAHYQKLYQETDGQGLICIPSGNHDMERLSYYLDEDERKVAFAFLFSMPGAPFLYYGDEIGMRYLPELPSKEGGFHRTGSRTPMQWDHSPSAGFSTAPAEKYYLPLDPSPDRPDAEGQMEDPNSLRSEVQRLIALRKSTPALQSCGGITFLSDGCPMIYRRTAGNQSVLVVLNPSAQPADVPYSGKVLYTVGSPARETEHGLTLPGCSAVFLEEA